MAGHRLAGGGSEVFPELGAEPGSLLERVEELIPFRRIRSNFSVPVKTIIE